MTDSFVERDHPVELTQIVKQSIDNLKANGKRIQMKGVKTLAALAQMREHIFRHPVCSL